MTVAEIAGKQVAPEELHILRHSLGLTYGDTMYRNHFVTGEGSIDYPFCEALVAKGLMRKGRPSAITGDMDAYFVTEEGKAIAVASQPKLTRSQKRYRQWLDVADVTGQSFAQYLKGTNHAG